jgi:hypothetical protein
MAYEPVQSKMLWLHLVYGRAMKTFENYGSSVEDVAECVRALEPLIEGPDSLEARAAFGHWCQAFTKARAATDRDAVKAIAREYLCTPNAHAASPYNIAQGLMKATIHVLWKKLYAVEVARGHAEVAEAVRDAVTPQQKRATEYFRVVLAEIAAETGESTDEMMARVCA